MSAGIDPSASGLPIVNQALEPQWVRHGSSSTKKAYESALAFEEMLVEQLSQSLAQTGGVEAEGSQEGSGGSEEGSSPQAGAGNGELSSLLPQALTSGVMRAGGLGLAAQMTRELEGLASTATKHAGEAAAAGAVAAPSTDTDTDRASSTATAGTSTSRSPGDQAAREAKATGGASAS